jgi:hypothetical protein
VKDVGGVPPRVLVLPTHSTSPLLHGERLGRAADHVARVVDEDVEAPMLGQHPGDGGIDGVPGGDVELDGAKVDRAAYAASARVT